MAASTTCPGAMTDGAARLLQRHLTASPDRLDPVERRVLDVDADGVPLGPWSIDGFKWFSSATDAGMAILLARTQKSKGLSA